MEIRDLINTYPAADMCEAGYVASFLQFLNTFGENIYTRDNLLGHIVVSAFVTNLEHTKVLMAFHKILGRWNWLGGHADGERDLAKVALQETAEESSLQHIRLVRAEPVSIEVLQVGEHFKNGKFIPAHLHYDVAYWLEADENEEICLRPDENEAIRWIKFGEIGDFNQDEVDNKIYQRIIKKIQKWDDETNG